MKYILTLLCFAWFTAAAQEPAYTPMRLNYQFRGIKVDSLFLVPSFNDTTSANSSTMKNVAGAMIRTGNDFWMRNAATTAWLQNVNVGNGASVSVQFVDSIYRIAGKDSIFWKKSGIVNKIKDSAGLPDSPDRIDGTAQSKVVSAFNNYDFDINSVGLFTLQANTYQITTSDFSHTSGQMFFIGAGTKGHSILLDTNLYRIGDNSGTVLFTADTVGNSTLGVTNGKAHIQVSQADSVIKFYSADPMSWQDKANGLKSQVKTAYADRSIDLAGGNYEIKVPGVYRVIQAGNDLVFPDPSLFPGQSITVINNAGADIDITSASGSIFDGKSNGKATVADTYVFTFYSDGSDYYSNTY
jgi:hypothetical protein